LGCAGGEGDALPGGELAEGFAGGVGQGDVDLGDLIAFAEAGVAEGEGDGFGVGSTFKFE
jgi:hypothetical protein